MASGAFCTGSGVGKIPRFERLHRDFQHAGSDAVQAFTYNGHREKMRVLGKEDLLEAAQPRRFAKLPAKSPNRRQTAVRRTLVAGNISNTNLWAPDDAKAQKEVRAMFDEMVGLGGCRLGG